MADAYADAQAAIGREDLWVTEYLLLLGPEAEHLDARESRAAHLQAQAALVRALRDVARMSPEHETRLTASVLADHERYVDAVTRLWSAVDAGDAARALDIEVHDIDPAFAAFERRVQRSAVKHRRDAAEAHASLERLQELYIAATVVLFTLSFALLALIARALRRYRRSVEAARDAEVRRLQSVSLTDSLTGLRNHRAFHEDLERRLQAARRSDQPLSLVLLDLDGLKETNDRLGHQAGDERLKELGSSMQETIRAADAAYRIGGDEFAIILEGTGAWGALTFVQRLQASFAAASLGSGTVTAGVAEAAGSLGKDALIRRADVALIDAKRSHRKSQIYAEGLEPHDLEPDREAHQHHLKTLATALARAVDARDSYTRSHSETVAEGCALIAGELGLDPEHAQKVRLAGLLHDVGKIGIADSILNKPGRLTEEEYEAMKAHSTLGYSIVQGAELEQEARWILHHHERLDGRGYPGGLTGDEIPLESRIILVADAFEAMTSDRPYRMGMAEHDAVAELERHAGTQFDPDCVSALRRALDTPAPGVSQMVGR